ncbi:MAG: MerR family transcriptional regulator [Clostridia bacterium]|nr:MerR family transcriptional regulator [Clostridia bacterium]
MRYSIGDVSRVLGMTTSALHFYEKEGIIDTPKQESGRRYYEEADINRLISAKKYRAMGVPVRDIASQFSADGMTGGQVMARIREKRDDALRLSREYAALAQEIDRLIILGEEAMASESCVDIRPAEDMLMFCPGSAGMIPKDKRVQQLMQRWLEAMPAVSLSICRDRAAARGFHTLMISSRSAAQHGLDADDPAVRRIPGGMALHASVCCGEEQYGNPDVIFAPILNFAGEHHFVQKGTMFGNQLVVDCSGGVRRHFYDTYMLFE